MSPIVRRANRNIGAGAGFRAVFISLAFVGIVAALAGAGRAATPEGSPHDGGASKSGPPPVGSTATIPGKGADAAGSPQSPGTTPSVTKNGSGVAAKVNDDAKMDGGNSPVRIMKDPTLRTSVERAVRAGLRYLSRRQNQADGSVNLSSTDTREDHFAPFALTAMAALAYMADGNSETRGPYAEKLKKAIDYILDRATFDPDGGECYLSADGDNLSRMHGHGYATLALAEVLGMGGLSHGSARQDRIRRTLVAAVRKIESSQGVTGGWYYTPTRNDDHEGSVTITLVQALRAARNAGVEVDSKVIKSAVEYVRKSQKLNAADPDHGSFRYRIASHETSVALTVAAISTLNATGDYDSNAIDTAMKFVQRKLQERQALGYNPRIEEHPSYELLYLAQAFRQYRDPDVFSAWFSRAVPHLLGRQEIRELENREDEGSWSDPYGRIFGTAVAIIVLRSEDSYLPILER